MLFTIDEVYQSIKLVLIFYNIRLGDKAFKNTTNLYETIIQN